VFLYGFLGASYYRNDIRSRAEGGGEIEKSSVGSEGASE
jgi:hypothetical protein